MDALCYTLAQESIHEHRRGKAKKSVLLLLKCGEALPPFTKVGDSSSSVLPSKVHATP